MLHRFGKNKIAAIPAIKSVIENGNIIYYVKNYNNIYDRYIIAARGKIDEKSAIIGVVINSYKSNGVNKFYLHEAEIIEANPSSMTGSPNGEDTVNESASTDIIPTSTEKSQVKYSISPENIRYNQERYVNWLLNTKSKLNVDEETVKSFANELSRIASLDDKGGKRSEN